MKIFELFGSILIENDKANQSLDQSESKAKKFASSLGGGIKTAAKFGAATAAAAGAAGAAIYGMASKAAEATDRIDKMSQKMGFSREGFQEWDFIMSQSGATIDGMKRGMATLNDSFGQLKEGSGRGADAFERLGISMEDLKGKSREEIFETTITALQGVTDESERATIAGDLLGKSVATELAPLLNSGAGSIEDMKNKAHDLGLVMSDDAIDAGVQFTDTIDQLTRSFKTAASGIGVTLMPMVQAGAQLLIDNMPLIQAVVQRAFDAISTAVQLAFDIFNEYFLPVITRLYEWVQANTPVMQEYWTQFFETARAVVNEVWTFIRDNWLPILDAVYRFIRDNFPAIRSTFESVFGVAAEVVKLLWDVMKGLWDFAEPTFPVLGRIIEAAFKTVITIVSGVTETFEGLIGVIRSAVEWLGKFDRAKTDNGGGNISSDLKQYTTKTNTPKTTTSSRGYTPSPSNMGRFRTYTTHGSHAGGIGYVPFDGYIAELHKGERVVPAEQNRSMAMAGSPITVDTMIVRQESDIKKIARELFRLQTETNRRRGV